MKPELPPLEEEDNDEICRTDEAERRYCEEQDRAYLDEQDEILCLQNLGSFRAGQRYPLSTRSVRFTRTQFKPNLQSKEEEIELSGQELAIEIGGKVLMDAALRADNVMIGEDEGAKVIQFTLQELADHFDIPEVPDIATTDPARYNAFIEQLHQLEQLAA
jgi:hypothetical protein